MQAQKHGCIQSTLCCRLDSGFQVIFKCQRVPLVGRVSGRYRNVKTNPSLGATHTQAGGQACGSQKQLEPWLLLPSELHSWYEGGWWPILKCVDWCARFAGSTFSRASILQSPSMTNHNLEHFSGQFWVPMGTLYAMNRLEIC